ncbi:MAG: hypothetical protein WHT46_07440 [Candidatus Geothermincolales bacterium]
MTGIAGGGLERAVPGAWGTGPERVVSGKRDGKDPALLKACREFEALFVREVLTRAGAVKALKGGPLGLLGGENGSGYGEEEGLAPGVDLYAEEALDALSRALASGGCLGLAEMLYRQLAGPGGEGDAGEGEKD